MPRQPIMALTRKLLLAVLLLTATWLPLIARAADPDYRLALEKALLFFEAQRSGKLPASQRVTWRNSSGLNDGKYQAGFPLVGGYHDAGDNVKFGFPLAFTASMLAWSIVEYDTQIAAAGQLSYALEALKWVTDYMILCHPSDDVYWVQVGDGASDHSCWQRPEDTTVSRDAYAVRTGACGSDVTAEAAAAMAAASMVYKARDATYSATLLSHSRSLFNFADTCRGSYDNVVTNVQNFYKSWSGYDDELMWGASWLYRATKEDKYLNYLLNNDGSLGGTARSATRFSWDDKRAGANVLIANMFLSGNAPSSASWLFQGYKSQAEKFLCSYLPGSPTRTVEANAGGLIQVDGVNSQYVTSSSFLASVYGDYLTKAGASLQCGWTTMPSNSLISFAKTQMDYLLGKNAYGMSYMVGFGHKYPLKPHHRGSTLPSVFVHPAQISCGESWAYYNGNAPNVNILEGGIVGGPEWKDEYPYDSRGDYSKSEVTTYINAAAIGPLARLFGGSPSSSPSPSPSPPPPSPPPPQIVLKKPTPPLSVMKKSPPPRSYSRKSPPPKSVLRKPPPPRKLGLKKSPPPKSYVRKSPPPPKRASPPPPPPAGSSQIDITQAVKFGWQDGSEYVTQYDVSIFNHGPGNIIALVISSINFQPKFSWNIKSTSNQKQYTVEQWGTIIIPENQAYTSFGYAQASFPASFSIVSFETDKKLKYTAPKQSPGTISQVYIEQVVQGSWPSGFEIVTQYGVSFFNAGPGNIISIVLWSNNYRPKNSWNLVSTGETNKYTFPWGGTLISVNQAMTQFGYQQADNNADFYVISYTTDTGYTFTANPPVRRKRTVDEFSEDETS